MKRISILNRTIFEQGESVTYSQAPEEVALRSEAQLHDMLADALRVRASTESAITSLRQLLSEVEKRPVQSSAS